MPRVYFSEKEAPAVIAIVEAFIKSNPATKTSEAVRNVPERISTCIELQARQHKGKKKPSDKSNG